MGQAASKVHGAMIGSACILAGSAYSTMFYSGMAVKGEGVLVTLSVLIEASSIFIEALIAALAVVALVVGVTIVVMAIGFVIYKVAKGIVYLKQKFDDRSNEEMDEHIKEAERQAHKQRPDLFTDCEEDSDDDGKCLWEDFRRRFSTLFSTSVGTRVIPSIFEWTPVVSNSFKSFILEREIYDLFDEFSLTFETLKGKFINRSTNIPSYDATDYKCTVKGHVHHDPITFPGYFCEQIQMAEKMLESGDSNNFANWFKKGDTETGNVVYILMCKQCTPANNCKSFYVGISTNFEKRMTGHRYTLLTDQDKTLPNHVSSRHSRTTTSDDILEEFFHIFTPCNNVSRTITPQNLRCHEVFYQWLLGPQNYMNIR